MTGCVSVVIAHVYVRALMHVCIAKVFHSLHVGYCYKM